MLTGVTTTTFEAHLRTTYHLLKIQKFIVRMLGLCGPEDGRMFDLGTGTYCVLGFEHEYRTVIRWNAPGPESSA